MVCFDEIKGQLMAAGMSEKEAKSLLNWYQLSGFLIPSNILALIIELLGMEMPTNTIYLLVAISCMVLSGKYVSNHLTNIAGLKAKLKILKPLCIVMLVLWVINVVFSILLIFS